MNTINASKSLFYSITFFSQNVVFPSLLTGPSFPPLFLTLEWHCSLCFDLGFHIDFSVASLLLFCCECVFFFWNPSYLESNCLTRLSCCFFCFAYVWLLMPLGFFSSFNIFIFYFLWLVFLCSIQVRIAPTVTTWSNKTPTALPSHPPAACPSDTQVYPSLFLFEQNSAHLNIYSYILSTLPFSSSPPPSVCLLTAFECFQDARSSF